MYACVSVDKHVVYQGLVACRTLEELRVLIHEKELLTGSQGRQFFVGSNREAAIRIFDNSAGFEVASCASKSTPVGEPVFYSPGELIESTIGIAMARGNLFTNEV